MILIFDKTNDAFLMSANTLPSEMYSDTDKYVIANVPQNETYDSLYSYTHKDGIAIKGDLISVDEKEEARKLDEWKAQQYQRDRKEEYDKLNQDEMRYDDMKNSTTTWIDAIDAIKAKYPKP
tara:strand:- start:3032 stop:3397 length:366 start_codon:yes stop_codon:yes gene_type:complete